MKPLLLLLLALFGFTVCAQSKSPSVTEFDQKDTYAFTVRVDKDRTSDLLACYNAVTDNDVSINARGDFSVETGDGVRFSLNSNKGTIRVRNLKHSPESADAARALAERVKQQLGLPAETAE